METTTVSSGVSYAGFWRRFVGWFIDFLIITILAHWATVLVSSIISTPIPDSLTISAITSAVMGTAIVIFIIDFIIVALYYCLLEASPLQATIGKYIAGIQITDMQGARITYGRALLRRVYSLLSIIPVFIGFIVAGFTSKKQTFHDMLAKTVVVIKHKKSGGILVIIVIATIILGILSDMFLGAGFHITFNSPTTHYDTQNGLQNYIIEQGNQVDPTLQNAIVTAFTTDKAIYASGDLAAIRKHFMTALPPGSAQQQLTNMSDSDLRNLISFFNKVADLTTEDSLHSPDATWSFNQEKTTVKISFRVKSTNGTDETVTINETYNNGQWYF